MSNASKNWMWITLEWVGIAIVVVGFLIVAYLAPIISQMHRGEISRQNGLRNALVHIAVGMIVYYVGWGIHNRARIGRGKKPYPHDTVRDLDTGATTEADESENRYENGYHSS